MAKEKDPAELKREAERKQLKLEKTQLKKEKKLQRKEAKKRAKEIAAKEDNLAESEEKGGISVFLVTVIIVAIWLAILALLVKLDVGGFGTNVLTPILKDVPVINVILPKNEVTETENEEAYGGYTSLKEAVEQIKSLELQLEDAQSQNLTDSDEVTELKAEVERLKTFEDKQTEFQRIKTEFYEEVIYAENGPGAEEYQKYYESIDQATAEYLYKQVIQEQQADQEIQDYAAAYSAMKAKEAAGIFEAMTDNLDLAAKILNEMSSDDRGAILGAMNADVAARLTKIMDPDS